MKTYEIEVNRSDFPDSIIGKIMHTIHFTNGIRYKTKEAYLELLKAMAKEIIKDIKTDNF